jgi:hypothetical protein
MTAPISIRFMKFLKKLRKRLNSPEFCEAYRQSEKDFSRTSKLSLPAVFTLLLSGLQGAVQAELNQFFPGVRGSAFPKREVSRQAFSQARKKLKTEAFWEINNDVLDEMQGSFPATWFGYEPIAADASTLRLVLQEKDVTRHYVTAQVFTLYAVTTQVGLKRPSILRVELGC